MIDSPSAKNCLLYEDSEEEEEQNFTLQQAIFPKNSSKKVVADHNIGSS